MNTLFHYLGTAFLAVMLSSLTTMADSDSFQGRWAVTLPNGAAGWLGIEEDGGVLRSFVNMCVWGFVAMVCAITLF